MADSKSVSPSLLKRIHMRSPNKGRLADHVTDGRINWLLDAQVLRVEINKGYLHKITIERISLKSAQKARRISGINAGQSDIPGHDGPGPDYYLVADCDGQNCRICADADTVPDLR